MRLLSVGAETVPEKTKAGFAVAHAIRTIERHKDDLSEPEQEALAEWVLNAYAPRQLVLRRAA